ncbi:PPP5-domain-containing protein [Patellaria atrata CBS 101060]|uniref:protein-serine/threonine phosphatase n=1 Tax=Patellaria atrata CBS 101060 TaxID=1346257 RepID=A0A9P4SED6_9PEZI|nr:PPP5-domain-containing protein [Patellaria atrata CBS 101060]
MTAAEEAIALKNKGNEAFKAHDWATAIEYYTKAIAVNDKEPSFYTNRAQANIKLESYGYAAADATKAIELDSNNVKHREALQDWKIVVKKLPGDKAAKLQHDQCSAIVKRDAFLKAIEIEDAPSAAEGLDIDNIAVEEAYDGVRLGKEMTQEFIDDMIQRFKDGKKIHKKYVYQIILAVKDIVYKEATMVETEVKEGTKITVCGDTHGEVPFISRLTFHEKPNTNLFYAFRPILRSSRTLPPEWLPLGYTPLSLQR